MSDDERVAFAKKSSRFSILLIGGLNSSAEKYMNNTLLGRVPLVEGARYLVPTPKMMNITRLMNESKTAWYDVNDLDAENPDR